MRNGFTTGSCSAAAAKAAAYMLLSGYKKEKINIDTPGGIKYEALVEDIIMENNQVSCAVRKDGGDDPDVTSGCLVYATVSFFNDTDREFVSDNVLNESTAKEKSDNRLDNYNVENRVIIEGGKGVGVVTRPGLDQPVGNAAINSVPRKMIEAEVQSVMEMFDYRGDIRVIISVPEGEEIAVKTFNPRLGIEGGISIIGTSGIVEPMSTKAILDTIKVELNQKKQEGCTTAIVSPGNYGLDFMKRTFDYDLDKAVKCSNFIGDTIDMAVSLGFESMLLVGHIGKLIKVSGGIMNTHSKEADSRMELMAAAALKAGCERDVVLNILECLTTEEAYGYIIDSDIKDKMSKILMERTGFYLNKRAGYKMEVDCIMYSNESGLIGSTMDIDDIKKKYFSSEE